jgi:hypothetical protein
MKRNVLLSSCIAVCALTNPTEAALILHYEIDSSTVVANTIEDTSPTQENDAARSGGGSFVLTTDRDGVANEAVIIPGSIAVSNSGGGIATTGGEFSMMTWYKGTDTGYIFDQQDPRFVFSLNENTSGIGVYFDPAGAVGGTWYQNNITGANDDAWHHIALVMDNNGVDSLFSIYLDGVAQDVDTAGGIQLTRTMTGKGILDLTTQGTNFRQRFGSNHLGNGAILAGDYDDIRVYNTALSASQVLGVIPEPSTGVLTLLASGALLLRRRR